MSRAGQFLRAVAALRGLNAGELRWVRAHLEPWEEALFWQMSLIDQKHAVRVSMRAVEIARRDPSLDEPSRRVLARAGLLHDIGKVRGDIGLFDRVAIVLVRRLAPRLAERLAAKGRDSLVQPRRSGLGKGLCRAFYAHAVHAERGAAMAELFGVEHEVVDVIRLHHRPPAGDRLLEIFAEADR